MDRTLVERARDGDHEAFAILAKASVDRLYAVATLILRDGDRAQDAVQEGLVAAWRGIRALREPDAWNAWLHRLVVRACYRLARSERRSTVVALRFEPRDEPSWSDESAAIADRDLLERGFQQLSLQHRAILVLHHYAGLPLSEAAAVLGIPRGTAKSRLHRATLAMRAAVDADSRRPSAVVEELA